VSDSEPGWGHLPSRRPPPPGASRHPSSQGGGITPDDILAYYRFKFQTATPAHSRGSIRPSFANSSALPKRGRRECRVKVHPQPRVQSKKAHEFVTTGSPDNSGIPCANGFNGFLRARLGDRALLPPSPARKSHQLDISVGTSGPHDFAVRLTARSSGAPQASIASRTQRP